MNLKLRELLAYDDIVVQCHDNPDADAIASGYAVYQYLKDHGKTVSFVYSGRNAIRKSNLVLMIDALDIPISYVRKLIPPKLLVMVDCQYGEGNVTHFDADNIAVLDHHRICTDLPCLSEIRTSLGACSTLIWQMLKDEHYDVNENIHLATALYYGLYKDTGGFAEITHPLDKDLRDMAKIDQNLIDRLRNANMSIEDLEVAGTAILRSEYLEDYRSAIVKAGECDPNILGIISDFVLEVDAVDLCMVFTVSETGAKLSVRSCVKTVQANEFAQEICKEIGSGGGHLAKAGGFIPMNQLIIEYERYCKTRGVTPRMVVSTDGKRVLSNSAVKAVLEKRLVDYFENSEIIDTRSYSPAIQEMDEYIKRPVTMGYIKAIELFPVGTQITVRTMKGDLDINVEEDTIIVVGIKGEISLNKEETFLRGYRAYERAYHLRDEEYNPTIKDNTSGKVISLLEHVKVCIPTGNIIVRAKQLDHNVKIFGEWDDSKYVKGNVGDYLLVREDDLHDVYIVDRDIFESCYEKVGEQEKRGIEAVIFDLDGTLLDTLQDLTEAVNAALVANNMTPRSLEEIRQFIGNGVEHLMECAVPSGKRNPHFDETFRAFKEYYKIHCKDNTGPYQDICVVMNELKQRGIKMAIVSNKMDVAVKELNREFFEGFTEIAIGETPTIARKPAPDTLNQALRDMDVLKEHAIYVGDADTDILTAKNAGIPCVSVTWGFRDRTFLEENGAKQIIDKPLDLLLLI